ncbi:MAG TPA: hypothetical protein VKB39_06055 [Candidatus Baltobacteraceae bacterium]|nr:hypothetical protein [Candidatus Baltobacteraceae bacterium]
MQRRSFLTLAAAVPLLAAAQPSDELALPVELRGGRFFALPRLTDGSTFACWLDTDGSGFVFAHAVRRLTLPTRSDGMRSLTHLPHFDPTLAVPPLVRNDGELPVFDPKDGDAADPILQGFDAQLGGSWFADRVWRLDFARPAMSLRLTPLPAALANVPVTFDRVYPQTRVTIAGETLTMSVDIAASVAIEPSGGYAVSATSFVRRSVFDRWITDHPAWKVERNVSTQPGIDRIVVPELHAGNVAFTSVGFTTRPDDDVFEGGNLAGKLGANAYAGRIVTIDYPNARLRIE